MASEDVGFDVVKREVFYAGGEYNTTTTNGTKSTYMFHQLYVEKLTPANPTQPYPLIFISGTAQTGTNFLSTPDGRPGWASFFLSKGYTVYLTDQPSRGRSPWNPSRGSMATISVEDTQKLFTSPGAPQWRLWPQAHLHTQWPGTGEPGDPAFDAFYASQVQFQIDERVSEEDNTRAYTALLDRVGEAYLVVHSQAGAYGWRIGDARPRLVKGIVAVEPSGPPFEKKFPLNPPDVVQRLQFGITGGEITYSPPAGSKGELFKTVFHEPKSEHHLGHIMQAEPAKKLVNLARIPVLVVTSEASYHAQYDYGTVLFLRQAGVEDVEYADLPAEGIRGNGHMMFMEKNNIAIAERILKWLQQH